MSKPNIDKTLPPEADLTDAADFQAPTPGEPTTALELKNYAPVQELTRIQKERGLPDADFARTIRFDYSGSVWGKIKAGTFNGSLPKAVLATKRALAFAITGRAIEAEHGTVMFDHVTATVDAVELARHSTDEHRLVLLVGQSGSGKSCTLQFLNHKYPGSSYMHAHPGWSKSYMAALTEIGEGIGLMASVRTVREAERAILRDLQARPRLIIIDEANHFNRDGIDFLKSLLNETRCTLVLATLPNNLRKLNAEHSHETLQLVRRAVAIIQIPAVDSAMVAALGAALFPDVLLNGYAAQVAATANKYHRIDTVKRIFSEADPDDAADLPHAMQRVERAIRVEGIR